jgi:biotin-dependent carboxylase-like uncharacterized protein
MTGFSPGFPYMGTLPSAIRVPRLRSPRIRVPARSVAMAGMQTGIYPTETPGGWRLLGRTPLRVYDPARRAPFLLEAGDRVRFREISADEYERLAPVDESPPAPVPPLRTDIIVDRGGLLTTVQDLGRPGYRRYGMPEGGAMDPLALTVTNALLANPPGAAALEFTFPGPRLVAARRIAVAFGGADLGAERNGRAVQHWSACTLEGGDIVTFGSPRGGQWGYLSVPGGFDVPEVLGSRSTYLRGRIGGHGGRRLERGDRLAALQHAPPGLLRLAGQNVPRVGGNPELRVVLGPQAEYFTEAAVDSLLGSEYRLSAEVDRVGYRLDGPHLAHRASVDLLSDGILPGAIQVPAGGQPIVVMADGPTAGGYPKIAAVVRPDLRLLAQAERGRALTMRAVPWEESRRAALDEQIFLSSLRFHRTDR